MDNNYDTHSKQDLIDMLKFTLDNIENLPQPALLTPITHYDLYAMGSIILAILKAKDEKDD
jgi:hypothetical protein